MGSVNHLQNFPTPGPSRSPPQSPPHHNGALQASRAPPETPRKRRDNHQQRLQGVQSALPSNLSLQSIRERLITSFKLSYSPDDWQVHLIRRILQGYDSIFCAGTGYGKSLVFEALAILGGSRKLVLVVSPLKALERDKVCDLPLIANGINDMTIYYRQTKPSKRALMLSSLTRTLRSQRHYGRVLEHHLRWYTCRPRWSFLITFRSYGRIHNFVPA